MSIFSSGVPSRPSRNKFNLNHSIAMSGNMGQLLPFICEDIVPGDKFRCSNESMIRFAPMISPIYHMVNVYTYYFFVPRRLVWNEWEDFITGGASGNVQPVRPTLRINAANKQYFVKNRLPDYLGVPPVGTATGNQDVDILADPFRAYLQVYNDYFTDENLQGPIPFSKAGGLITDGTEMSNLTQVRNKSWEKDYATSAFTSPQRGTAPSVPIQYKYRDTTDLVNSTTGNNFDTAGALSTTSAGKMNAAGNTGNARIENLDENAGGITIEDLRSTSALQRWMEKQMRGGSRYIEQMLQHFGVVSKDSRLQRAEFLHSSKTPVSVSEVLNTTGTAERPQADMAGHGISVGASSSFRRKFTEHGYLIGMACILPRTQYMNGIHRKFTRMTKFDHYWPEFAQLGEQEVRNQEIAVDYDGGQAPTGVFGYQSRYAEYKYSPSIVAAEFRDTLAHWTMARDIKPPVQLNSSFVTADPTHRIFAVTDENVHKLYMQFYNRVDALRPMPYYNVPTLR